MKGFKVSRYTNLSILLLLQHNHNVTLAIHFCPEVIFKYEKDKFWRINTESL